MLLSIYPYGGLVVGKLTVDFKLTEEQSEIQMLARSFSSREMAPFAAEWDDKCTFPSVSLFNMYWYLFPWASDNFSFELLKIALE